MTTYVPMLVPAHVLDDSWATVRIGPSVFSVTGWSPVTAEDIERDLAPRTGNITGPRISDQLIRRTAATFADHFGRLMRS